MARIASVIRRIIQFGKSIIININLDERSSEYFSSKSDSAVIPKNLSPEVPSPKKVVLSSHDKDEFVSPKNTSLNLEEELRGLRLATYRGHKLRYKPLLLLATCHLIDSGQIPENKIFLTTHLEELYEQIALSVGYVKTDNIGLPYFHLRTSSFWCHKVFPGKEQLYKNHPRLGRSRSILQQTIEYAFIHPHYFDLFFNEYSRRKIQQILLESFFSEAEKKAIQKIFQTQPQPGSPPLHSEIKPEIKSETVDQTLLPHDEIGTPDQDQQILQPEVDPEPCREKTEAIHPETGHLEGEGEIKTEESHIKPEFAEELEDLTTKYDRENQNLNLFNLGQDDKVSPQISMRELSRRGKGTSQILSRPTASVIKRESDPSTKKPKKKRDIFYFDFYPIPEIKSEILNEFLERGEKGTLKEMVGIDPIKFEEFLLNAFKMYEFIGELPFSQETFNFIREVICHNYILGSKREIRGVPAALFVSSMVFCARYSEEDARKFWQPYADLVWQTDPTQYFQHICRKHYLQSRDFLLDHFDLAFPALRTGEVVKPIYYQAVIPNYLQSTFAQWLISNFEQVLQFSTENLPSVLQKDISLNYMPKGFKNFVTGSDTREAAAKLITQLSNAIKLFQTTEQFEAVASIMDSPIERSLWKEIYQELIKKGIALVEKVRSYTAKLDWVWDIETNDLGLQLSQVRSHKGEKPDLIIWASKDNERLIIEDNIFDVDLWPLENGDWELETKIIHEFGDLDGELFVLSEQFNLEELVSGQEQQIIFRQSIPAFPEDNIFIFIPSKGMIARSKEQINVNGNWIIFSKEEFDIRGRGHQSVNLINSVVQIPPLLRKAGFQYGKQYQLILPIDFKTPSGTVEFDQPGSAYILEAELMGEKQIEHLSPRVQPIFKSKDIRIQTLANFPTKNFQRIWFSIHRGNKFRQSISLDELQKQNLLNANLDQFSIGLSPYINESGSYSIYILHNLQNLLETPLEFAFLPDFDINGPEANKCYSPEHPAVINTSGIIGDYIVLPVGEKVKVEKTTTGIRLVMREMRRPEARFSLQWDGNNVQICYDIERVTAWIDGCGDKHNVIENQTEDLFLHVRGNPNESFNWIVNDSQFRRDIYLNAKGEFDETLDKSILRDILKQSGFINTEISILIRKHSWPLFTFTKIPKVIITEIVYKKPNIIITLEQEKPLAGTYKLQVRNATDPMKTFVIGVENKLQKQHTYRNNLEPGLYILEIFNQDVVITKSTKFEVPAEKKQEELPAYDKIQIKSFHEYTVGEMYGCLSASPHTFLSLRNQEVRNILPILEQLKVVNDENTWINLGEKFDYKFKVLLPCWAVLNHPLRVITERHRKIFHIFPQKALYGGNFGKGYMKAKFPDGSIKLYAAWSTKNNQTKIWLKKTEKNNASRFYDLDEGEMLPCYQCIDCGEIIPPKAMNFNNWPPKIIMDHKQKELRPVHKQFADVGNFESIQVGIQQYRGDYLDYVDTPLSIINNDFFFDLLEGKQEIKIGEMSRPINIDTSQDYEMAISEVVSNHSETIHKFKLKQILGKQDLFKNIESTFAELSSEVQAFNAFFRLYQRFKVPNILASLPKRILLLAMLLRYKAHHPKDYKSFIQHVQTDENEIAKTTQLAMTSCPKLMEWSIFWAEVFFHHTAS